MVKERLAGAIIMVALAVIFVPTLFDGEGHRELSRLQVEMPEPPALVFGQHFSALGDDAASGAASTTARAVPPRRPPVVAAPPTPSAKAPPAKAPPAKAPSAKAPPAKAPSAKAPPAKAPPAKAPPAKAPSAKAPSAKAPPAKAPPAKAPPAKAPPAKAPSAKAPSAKAPSAKAPSAKAPPAGAASRLDIWVVQTGIFAVRKNADAQRARLRKAGFDPVFYKRHEKRRGETMYSVRIGPYEGRPAAVSVAKRLRREHGLETIIKAYGDND